MDSTKDYYFYSNACQICRIWGKDAKLKTCVKCKSIGYCSREHQKEHWPRHKEFCQAYSEVKKCADMIYTAFYLQDIKYGTNLAWKRTRANLIELTESCMNRELSYFEKAIIMFPRCCEICYESDPSKLNDCNDCPDASFCIEHPKDSKHLAKCEKSKLSLEANTVAPNSKDLAIIAIAFASHYGASVPTNMDEAIGLYLSHPLVDNHLTTKDIYSIILSNDITKPYTFLYAMQKLSCPLLQKLTIHVIVRGVEENDRAEFWQNLLHHNLPLKEIEISYFGLDLETKMVNLELCDACVKNDCRITVNNIGDTYGYFARSPFFSKPHFVVGFNLALFDDDELAPTIRVVGELGCPFFVTTFLAKETERNEERINLFLGKTVKPFWTGVNPFAGRKPLKDFETDDFVYHNQYLSIYEKLA